MPAPRTHAPVSILWFKRDLRVEDHAALVRAAAAGPVLPLYIVEPGFWDQPTMAGRHWGFVAESLEGLAADLAALGSPLLRVRGEAVAVLDALHRHYGAVALFSHEETGDAWTYARDRAVAAWARARGVVWTEVQGAGVIRRLASRDGWARAWDAAMRRARLDPPALAAPPPPPALGWSPPDLAPDPCAERQPGGRAAGRALLAGFLAERGRDYRRAMASPVTGFAACSRLSPHLAWGTLSTREVAQDAWEARARVRAEGRGDGWAGSLDSFLARLAWRCHFMQKLEDEPALEHRCLHPAFEALDRDADPIRLAAWVRGETGLPFVDACMRALAATGWMNFRMRAMVAAVAGYHLWLDWRAYGPPLARLFTDYEPGIHWSQVQMQAGTTGINATRVYNPVKQQRDQDPEGAFVRRWLPELARVPLAHLHEPWRMDRAAQAAAGCVIGRDYPAPIVDPAAAARAARARIHAPRRSEAFRAEAAAIVARHASRKRPSDRLPRRPRRPADPGQLRLDL